MRSPCPLLLSLGATLLLSVAPLPLSAQDSTRIVRIDTAPPPAPPTASAALPMKQRNDVAEVVAGRRQQESFERTRRLGLRFYNGGADATCEERIGRLCYWNNNGDVPPPAERADLKADRAELLTVLSAAAAAAPDDDWTAGALVRYLSEAGQYADAVTAARACRGSTWWCQGLLGLALHQTSDHRGATAAFDAALAAMTPAQRCEWLDVSLWLDAAARPDYANATCEAKAQRNTLLFWLAQPLAILDANDLRNELLARRVISRVHAQGFNPYDMSWGSDMDESQYRYGWPVAWSIQNGGVADPRPVSVIGHEPTPSYDFMPESRVVGAPLSASQQDWDLARRKARMRYAPRYASGFKPAPHQLARFRRNDSTLVVGSYRLVRELEMGRGPYRAGLVLATSPTNVTRLVRDSAPAAGGFIARVPAGGALASLEVWSPTSRRATRVRSSVQPLPADAKISDLLFTSKSDQTGRPSLEWAASAAFGAPDIPAGTTLGLYWESYLPASPGAPARVSIEATRLNSSGLSRFLGGLRLTKAMRPVSVQFADQGRPDGAPGRSISLTWPEVPAGTYRLTLAITSGSVTDSTSTTVRILER
ncbi:MAG: hypothetical protein MUE41_05925 [Gemmatimonadaceae bacterium]|nr:hypothetical protein [Gemmatimonadaceae bacterium]